MVTYLMGLWFGGIGGPGEASPAQMGTPCQET